MVHTSPCEEGEQPVFWFWITVDLLGLAISFFGLEPDLHQQMSKAKLQGGRRLELQLEVLRSNSNRRLWPFHPTAKGKRAEGGRAKGGRG